MAPDDPGTGPGGRPLGRLLRWYPRGWRERYGEEFLAMVEDTLDGRGPGWRLHLSVAWSGVRERVRRAVPAVLRSIEKEAGQPLSLYVIGIAALSSLIYFWSILSLTWIPLSAGEYRWAKGAVAADVLAGLCAVIGVAVIGGGLAGVPALVRSSRLDIPPGVRAVQLVLSAVAASAFLAIAPVQVIWNGQAQDQGWLLGLGAVLLVYFTRTAPYRLRGAWRVANELRRG